MRLSSRAAAATASPTLALTARVKALKQQGVNVIGFGAGEPDFDTPEPIKEAARQALADGFTKYCPSSGIPTLRQAVADKIARCQGLSYQPGEIIVSNGGKHSLYVLLQALLDPGDAVLLPAPYWVSYVDMTRLAGGAPIILPTTEATGLKLTPEQLAEALELHPYAKALILNSPSNPTGATYTAAELRRLAAVLKRHPGCLVISDEIYEHLLYDGRTHIGIGQVPGMQKRTAIVNGVSKAYSMTGWRIGWTAGPRDLIDAMDRIQSHDTSGPCSIAQVAAEAALRGDQTCVETMRQAFEQRRDVMVRGLRALPGVTCTNPGGAFYAFPDIGAHCRKGETAQGFAARLLDEAQVAVVPGESFGAPYHVRLSYAASMADIEEGLRRMAGFLGA
ncbi:MAG: pyridoxal phosphate-dependent aminotransferase [Armatimonadetes bacterium]|nr:pyridoxal phosphate-dependent aminotransferase [Armatimonadota bacterium]